MKNWAAVDCESDAFDGQAVSAFIWGYQTADGERGTFWDTGEFIDWARNFDGLLYAHNGGKFDWLMSDILAALDWDEPLMLINGRIAKAKMGKAELRDSWLCLPQPLAAFGAKDTGFDYSLLKREKSAERRKNKAVIERYLMQDCAALAEALHAFKTEHGEALTQAGAALKYWEKMGGEKRRYGPEHDRRFRPFYAGGRCECYTRGEVRGDFEIFDINSSYPAAMMGEHPAGTDYKATTEVLPFGFYSVSGISRGAFWYRDEHGRLSFPRDGTPRLYQTTGHELIAALELGIFEPDKIKGVIPRRTESFAPYVQHFYTRRAARKAAGDRVGEQLDKLAMNSLYGKLATNCAGYKDYRIVEPGKRPKGWTPYLILPDADILQRPTTHPEYYDVAAGASITGAARANLMRAIFKSRGVLYCDTDSIFCEAGKFGGEIGTGLGQWKREARFNVGYFAGKKLYTVKTADGWKCAHKGASQQDITPEDIRQIALGETVTVKKSAPTMKLDGRQVFLERKLKIT